MKKITIIAALLALVALTGQAKEKTIVWEHPATAENTEIEGFFRTLLEITSVEFSKDETRVKMHMALRPEYGLKFVSETYLMADGKRYALKSCEGLELDKEVHLTDHGQADVVFHFEPLPLTTERFDFIEGDAKEAFKILGVESATARARRLFPSNWRNEQTGDWEIGFYEDFAIYDCRFWQYKRKEQKGDKYTFVLENDGQETTVSVGKSKDGRRTIAIDGKVAEYGFISSITLPDYPTKDTSTDFRDTHYQTDTVTFVGWLKDMPKWLRDKGNEYKVSHNNIFTDEQVSSYGKMDSLGRFVMKVPMLNSATMFYDWERTFIRTLFEPGETYFMLYDFKEGHKLFMGKNCRLQNETLAYPMGLLTGERTRGMDEAAVMRYFESIKNEKADLMAELRKVAEAHPTISDRYITYLTNFYNTCEGRELMQARYFMNFKKIPDAYLDYVSQHWQQPARPYTLYREFGTFKRDYVEQLVDDRYATRGPKYTYTIYHDMEALTLRRYRDAGKVAITDEELAAVERYGEGLKQLYMYEDDAEAEKAEAEFDQQDYVKLYDAVKQREDVKQVLKAEWPLFPIYHTLTILDSIGCDRDLRDIIITRQLYDYLDNTREPLKEPVMQYFEENVTLPAAKTFLRAEQDKYLAIQRRDISKSASLKANNDLADMSDGEKILRKIIEPYRGRLILLDVWGTWCAPCKAAMANSKEEFERLKDFGLVYLYLANNSSDESWKNVIKEYDLTGDDIVHYNLPADQQRAIERFLDVHSYPSYRLIDRDGTVLDVNADPRDLEGLVRLLEKLK